jgi:signal transduction histidine kinase/CheY-like chemotaxis protein
MKKIKGFSLASPIGFIVFGNILFVVGIVVSIVSYTWDYREKIKNQNLEDISNITLSSATISQDFFLSEKARLDDAGAYITSQAMDRDQALSYLALENSDSSTLYELIDTTAANNGKSYAGFLAKSTNGASTPVGLSYSVSAYPSSFISIFTPSAEDILSNDLHCSVEFTDASSIHQSFALYRYLTLSASGVSSTYALLSVHESRAFANLINNNASYTHMTSALIEKDGDYLFGSSGFKSDNLFKYFYLFNSLSYEEKNADLIAFQRDENPQRTFFYKNGSGEDSVFVIKPVGPLNNDSTSTITTTGFYCVSSVPLSDFHNSASSSSIYFILIIVAILLAMMAFNFSWMARTNRQLKEAVKREKEAAEKEKNASDAKSDFFSRMSHDIRTPLNVMIGSATLALKESNNSATNRYLSDIDESGKFLLSLVNDLLDLNKVESGKMTLHLAPYSLAEFAEAMTSIVGPLCKEKSIVFSLEGFESKQPYEIDAIRFKQIFFNLLSNSVKFTPAGGRISLRGSWGKSEDNFDKLLVTESDNGAGMSEEFQQKMFDPFSQEDRLMTPGVNGTGLGLAIVKSLVALMGGEIHVRSAIGVGTTFSLSFPLKKSSAQPIVEPAIEAANESLLKGVRVLLCEDNPMNTKIAKALLEAKGMKVETAVNGKAGLERFASSQPHSFDVILMDMRMPVMDGVTATKEIRALHRPEARSIPIIAMTANAYAEDVKACLEAGMNAHLAKPVDPEAMYQEIIRALPKK